jgi:hypothetical protein
MKSALRSLLELSDKVEISIRAPLYIVLIIFRILVEDRVKIKNLEITHGASWELIDGIKTFFSSYIKDGLKLKVENLSLKIYRDNDVEMEAYSNINYLFECKNLNSIIESLSYN